MTEDRKDTGPEDEFEQPVPGSDPAEGPTDATADESAPASEPATESSEPDGTPLSDEDAQILAEATAAAEDDLIAEYRDRAARAEAELVNFRIRVERDRQVNRDSVIAEVLRSVIPALDDLSRAETNGDVPEGSAIAMVAQKLRGGFEKFGLRKVGEKGEPFDPTVHEAIVQFPAEEVEKETVFDVIEPGYLIGERVIRPAKVAVSVPKQD